jgi:uncharacterized protein (UPF0332 family)
VTPETGLYLAKAHKLLAEAEAMLSFHLHDAAGRTAYLAGFHAAQALISEVTRKSVKTHKGVHRELHRLTAGMPGFDNELRAFLSKSYSLKSIADYETGPENEVSPGRANEAVEQAKRFVRFFDESLGAKPSPPEGIIGTE